MSYSCLYFLAVLSPYFGRYLLLARLMVQYCFARWRLSSSVTMPAGRPASRRARGQSGGRHCTAGQYGNVPLGRHLVSDELASVSGYISVCPKLYYGHLPNTAPCHTSSVFQFIYWCILFVMIFLLQYTVMIIFYYIHVVFRLTILTTVIFIMCIFWMFNLSFYCTIQPLAARDQ